MPPKGKGKKLTKADKAKLAAKEKAEANRAAAAADKEENENEEGGSDAEEKNAAEAVEGAEGGEEKVEEKKAPAAKKPAPMKIKRVNDYRSATAVLESHVYSKDIKLGGFTLQAYGNELIKSASIELTIGRRYGLIGANGSGKSSFLRCLAAREVPIPDHIDVFMLDHEAPPSEMSALEAVVDVVKGEQQRLEALGEELLGTLGPDHEAVQLLYEKLDALDPHTFEMRAGKLLHGLGFTLEMQRKATKDMSGGWRMRVSLARALFVRPTLLILDEPTNHLDLEACVWLERYLADYPFCLLIVSHSQDFLNGVCTNIMHLTESRLEYYKGNYDTFVKTKAELEVNQMKHYQQEQDDIKHIKAFIASCGTFSNLVRQAKSKQKILDKMYAKGLTPRPTPPIRYKFEFSKCEKLPPPVMSFVDVAFAYSGNMKDALYKNVNLGVDMDSRIALVGPNGAGKSTLLKLMCADIYPTQGTVRRHLHIKIARYHQHSADQLDKATTPLDFFVKKFADMRLTEDEWRQHLGRYGVSGKNQLTVMGNLSDGIQSRIVFALMSIGYPNILLLDEPTNHLDMDCIDSLAEAINKFDGGMVLVSHDFRLIDQVAKTIWVCDNGDIKPWKGDIRSYKASIAARINDN